MFLQKISLAPRPKVHWYDYLDSNETKSAEGFVVEEDDLLEEPHTSWIQKNIQRISKLKLKRGPKVWDEL